MQMHPKTKLMKKDGLIIFSEKLSTIGKVDKNFNERKLVKCHILWKWHCHLWLSSHCGPGVFLAESGA